MCHSQRIDLKRTGVTVVSPLSSLRTYPSSYEVTEKENNYIKSFSRRKL